MQVSVESTGALTRKLTIAVPAAEFEGQVAQRVKSTAGKVSLPGFRRGHVPLKEVERRYGASLRREVATEMVQSRLPDALREQDVPIIGTPSVELVNIERGADLLFTASFEVLPDIDLVDLTTLTVMKPVAEITEADIDDMVETLRRQRVEWIPVERPAQADDRVVVDVSVRIEGKEVSPDGQDEDVTFVVGDGQATAELDAAVVGMTVGENRVYPVRIQRVTDDSSSVPSAVGEVRMKRVEAPRLPELDDAFFAFFGVDDGESPAGDVDQTAAGDDEDDAEDGRTDEHRAHDLDGDAEVEGDRATGTGTKLAQFRDGVRERMLAELDVATRNATRRQVMSILGRVHAFDVPRTLLDAELADERERLAKLMGVPAEEVPLRDGTEARAEERVRIRLVVREIVERESLTPDDQRVRGRVEQIVSAYEEPDDVRKWIYGNETELRRIELDVLEDQLIEHVLTKVAVESVSASYKDVLAGTAVPHPPPLPPTGTDPVPAPAEAAIDVPDRDKPRKGLLGRLFGAKRS